MHEEMPDSEALEAALDFFYPTYRPTESRAHGKAGDIQAHRLAYAMREFSDRAVEEVVSELMTARQWVYAAAQAYHEGTGPLWKDLRLIDACLQKHGGIEKKTAVTRV
jgi:hypothetical protein